MILGFMAALSGPTRKRTRCGRAGRGREARRRSVKVRAWKRRFDRLFRQLAGRVRFRRALRGVLSGATFGAALAAALSLAAFELGFGELRWYAGVAALLGAALGWAHGRRRRWSDGEVALFLDARLGAESRSPPASCLEERAPGAAEVAQHSPSSNRRRQTLGVSGRECGGAGTRSYPPRWSRSSGLPCDRFRLHQSQRKPNAVESSCNRKPSRAWTSKRWRRRQHCRWPTPSAWRRWRAKRGNSATI